MSNVAIIGAGMMGTAMCWPLAERQHHIFLVGTPLDREIIQKLRETGVHETLMRAVPEGIEIFDSEDIPAVLPQVDWVINGVSSFGIPWFAKTVGPHLAPHQAILSVTKGLEGLDDGSLMILPEAIRRRFPASLQPAKINAIAGPCIAHELAARRQTGVVFTGEDAQSLEFLQSELMTDYYHVWTSTDVVSAEVCAALKNAYAACVGLAVGMLDNAGPDGVANMYNPQAMLFAQGIHEMGCMLELMGGNRDALHWLPGPGDLFVTVFGGRTVKLGRLLGQGIPYLEARQILAGVTLESVEIIARLARALTRLEGRGLARRDDFPLLFHMNDIIHHAAAVDIPWQNFFKNRHG